MGRHETYLVSYEMFFKKKKTYTVYQYKKNIIKKTNVYTVYKIHMYTAYII